MKNTTQETMKKEDGNNGSIISYNGIVPTIPNSAFICEGVRIIGDVQLGENVSVWYNSVIRGDVNYIRIGDNTNIQDLAMLHVTNEKFPLIIGNNVTIGHSVVLHGCTVKDSCLIGIGAKVLDNSVVSSHTLVAAGSVIKEGWTVPEGTLVAGVPAKVIRDLSPEEIIKVGSNAKNYIKYIAEYRRQAKESK